MSLKSEKLTEEAEQLKAEAIVKSHLPEESARASLHYRLIPFAVLGIFAIVVMFVYYLLATNMSLQAFFTSDEDNQSEVVPLNELVGSLENKNADTKPELSEEKPNVVNLSLALRTKQQAEELNIQKLGYIKVQILKSDQIKMVKVNTTKEPVEITSFEISTIDELKEKLLAEHKDHSVFLYNGKDRDINAHRDFTIFCIKQKIVPHDFSNWDQ